MLSTRFGFAETGGEGRTDLQGCNFAERCCFRHQMQTTLRQRCGGLLENYCQGPLFRHCERRRYFLEAGECAPAHLLPSGETVECIAHA